MVREINPDCTKACSGNYRYCMSEGQAQGVGFRV